MESESVRAAASTDGASEQLEQLRRDQRWAKLTGDLPAGYDAIVGGCLVIHLLFLALTAGLSSGQIASVLNLDSESLFLMAMVNLFIAVFGQVAFQRAVTGSWRGTAETRFSAAELTAAAVSYLLGLVMVLLTAAHGMWVLAVMCAVLAGVAWVLTCRHWMIRYRAEFGYQVSLRVYVKFPLYVVGVFLSNLAWLYALSLLGRLLPGL